MKYDYHIMTDATSNLPEELFDEDFSIVPMEYVVDGKVYSTEGGLSGHEFFEKMRDGAAPTTTLITKHKAIEYLSPLLEEGRDIFFVCFSSELSGSYRAISEARGELMEKYPARKIHVMDSRAASAGEGMLVLLCLKARREGASFDELVSKCETLRSSFCQTFTVDSLMNLYRGGRLSMTAAIVGTAIKVKPLLIVNGEGRLIPVSKIMGRKASLNALVERMKDLTAGMDRNGRVLIEHADCPEEAAYVRKKIAGSLGYKNISVLCLGPIIGAHLGPGAVNLVYEGRDRDR